MAAENGSVMKLGRKAKRGLLLLGGFLLLFVLVHTPPVKSLARWGVARVTSSLTGATASLARLDYRLWRGEFVLSGFSLEPEGESGFSLNADRVRATLSPTLRLSAEVDRLDLAWLGLPEGEGDTDPAALLSWINVLRIRAGVVRFRDTTNTGFDDWLTIEAIAADLTKEGDEHRLTLHADRSVARVGGAETVFDALDADLYLSAGSLRLVSAALFKEDSFVRAEGEIDLTDAATGAIDLQYALDGSLARLIDEELVITGVASGIARAGFDAGELTIEAEVGSEAVAWDEVVLSDVRADLRYADQMLRVVHAEARGFGGEAQMTGELEVRETGARRLELTFRGLDVVDALRRVAEETLPISARVGGDARLQWTGWQIDEAAGDARIQLEPGADLRGSIAATLRGGLLRLESENLAVPAWGASLSGRAEVDPAAGEFEAEYDLTLGDLGELPVASPIPVSGALEASGRAGGAFDAPVWTATVTSESLSISGRSFVLAGELDGSAEAAELRNVRLEGAGGVVLAAGNVPLVAGQQWGIGLTIAGVAADASMVESFGLEAAGIPFEARVDADLELTGRFEDPDWTAEVRVPEMTVLGVPGTASASVSKLGREMEVRELRGSYAGGSLEGSGRYVFDTGEIGADLSLRGLQAGELPFPEQYAEAVTGTVDLEATLSGTVDSPQGRARFTVGELSYNDVAVPDVDFDLAAQDRSVSIEGTTRPGSRFLVGGLQLEDDYPLHAEIELSALPSTEWMRALAAGWGRDQDQWVVEGAAQVDISLAAPESLTYSASIESVEARFPERIVRAAPFRLAGDAASVRIDGLALTGEGVRLSVDATLPVAADEEIDLVAQGRLDLAALRLLDPGLLVEGLADVDVIVTGPISSASGQGGLTITGARGSYGDLTWTGLDLAIDAANDRPTSVSLTAEILGGSVEMAGTLPGLAGGSGASIELDVRDVDLASLLPAESRTSEFSAMASISGKVDLPALDLEAISGAGEITSLVVTSGTRSFGTVRPAAWRVASGALSLPDLRLEGDGATLDLALAHLRLADGLDFRGLVSGRLDAELLNPLLAAQGMQVRGEATLDVEAAGNGGTVSLAGGGSIRGGRLTSLRPRFSLTDAAVDFDLSDTSLVIPRFEARSGSGRLQGSGTVDWTELNRPLLDLRLDADAVPLEIMTGFRGEVAGELRLSNSEGPARLTGSLLLDRGIFTREFDDDQQALSSQSIALRDPSELQGALSRLGLDLVIATERNIFLENSTAFLEVAGSVSVRGTVAIPEAGGVLTVVPGGTFDIGRNRLEIVRGRVDLTGVPALLPYLDVQATTRVGTTTINVEVEGYADDLRTRLTAPDAPDLTEGDLASLLVTGRTLENAGEGGAQIASAWALSSLAGLVHEGLGDLITFGPPPGAGPMILSEEADPTARLSFGFPVTERLSVTYSIALDSAERRLFILDYRVARNIWLRGIQENSADFGLGISQRFEFNLRRRPPRAGAAPRRNQVVRSVSVEGAPSGVGRRPRIDEGDRFDYWRVRDEADRLREELIAAGYLSALVDVETSIEEGETADEVSVRFAVTPGGSTSIVWAGDDPGGSIRRDIERAWDGRVPEEFLLADATQSLRTRLRAQRYFSADAVASIERRDGPAGPQVRVVYEVTKGPRGSSVALSFDGNEVLTDEQLVAALPGTGTPEFFKLLEQPPDLERGLRLRYAADGFLDATSGTPRVRFDSSTGILNVEVPVNEGEVTRVAAVDVGEGRALDPSRIEESFAVAAGGPVDFPQIREGQSRVRALYRSEGFSDVRVRADLTRSERGLDVSLVIEEGMRARVGEIRVVGNNRTLPRVVRNELTFRSGDPIRLTDFQSTQKRLYDLAIFRSADVRPDPAQQGQEIQDVIIQVVERSDVDVSYGVRYNWVNSEQSISKESEPRASGFEVNARVNFVNQFRRGTNLGFAAFYQGNHQLFRGTLRMPTFFSRRIVTELIVETEQEELVIWEGIPSLESRSSGFTFQQTRKLTDNRTDKFSLQWNFRYAKFRADRFDFEGEGELIDAFRPRFGISLIEDRRDSFVNPTRGRFWNVTLQVVPEIWGSDVGYVRLYGQGFFYYPLFGSIVWASGYRAGVSSGTQEFLLIEDRFQAGGANSVRGYKQNTLGPAVFISGPEIDDGFLYIGGQAVAVINQEIRFPIWRILHGGLFWDAGNVWATRGGFRLGDLKHSVGAGLRVVLPFGALRFDYAEALNPCSLEALQRRPISSCAAEIVRFHFAFGYAF